MAAPARIVAFLLAGTILASLAPTAAALEDPNPENDKWIEGTLIIKQPSFTEIDVSGELIIRKFVVEGTDYRTADDLGNAYQQLKQADEFAERNGQHSHRALDFVNSLSENITKALDTSLKTAFPGAKVTVEPTAIDTATLASPSGDPYLPGVRAVVSANIVRSAADLGLDGVTEDGLAAVFQVGAVVGSTITLSASPGEDITYVLSPPEAPAGLVFSEPTGTGVSVRDGDLVIHLDAAASTTRLTSEASFKLSLPDAPRYSAAEADIGIVVDLKDLDISIGKAVNGDLGNLLIDVGITGNLGVIEVPDDLKASFGDKLSLDYLSSDAIRLLYARGVIDDAKLAELEGGLLKLMGERLSGALGGNVDVTGGFQKASLAANLMATPLSGDKPVVFTAAASFTKPLSGEAPPPTAAIALYTQQQSFALPRVEGLDTTYTVILPKGLAVTALDATGGESEIGTSADGRSQFTVTPTSDEAQATVSMAVTPTFVLAKFWPVVLGLVVFLVLLIGTPIAIVMARSRRK